jgi:hypothetical protein
VFETNIVVIHDQTPHVSLPNPPFLRSRLRHISLSLFDTVSRRRGAERSPSTK